jgi:L-seryl-tRNA(Ser) seleniumtransferase
LTDIADGRDAIISRGELIEIGGNFRIPDIMAKSGSHLVEVGTTNRTHLADYRNAFSERTGAVVKIHRSNFSVSGFVAEVHARELVPLSAEHGVPLLHDLGSGLFISLERFGLRGEPAAADAVLDGTDIVTMSGDKLLGGPQAGIALGRADLVSRMRKNPLTRALRVDKVTLAALEATLALYRDPARAVLEIPALAMLAVKPEQLRARAEQLRKRLATRGVRSTVVDSEGSVGGGAFPAAQLSSAALALEGDSEALDIRLRAGSLPVIGRITDGRLLIDLRSVPEGDDGNLEIALVTALA